MRIERLIGMANDIAAFFAGAEAAAAAPRATAAHLQRFWSPAMRRQLEDYARRDGAGLTPTARAAVALTGDGAPH